MKTILFSFIGLLTIQASWAKIIVGFSHESALNSNLLNAEERFWLNPTGPLNPVVGVTGSRGPLGSLGPFGGVLTQFFQSLGNWSEFSESLTEAQGPLSEMGPLFLASEFSQSLTPLQIGYDKLVAGGVLHSLGNAGALGPLGIAGPLGPHGAHGFSRDEDGHYKNEASRIVEKIKTPAGEFELYELYTKLPEKLDSSFAYFSETNDEIEVTFKSHKTQWINILILNEYDLDRFGISVSQTNLKSHLHSLTNAINIKAEAGTSITVKVKLLSSLHFMNKPFRLFVTGAPKFFEVSRPFQQPIQ
ncbi:MAG: hypothetical protein CME65_14290 [Halobacteriovoraceae bacterium]|nr:hypothetical protein [Halobacteriovoraceae bacterium]